MTGRDPMRLGVAYGVIMPWMNIGIHPAEHFMPQTFQAAGYQTAMVGKWHLGHALQAYHPNERGFDHFYGHLHTEVGYFPPFGNQGGRDFQENGKSIEKDGIYMPFIAPHTPLDAPEDLQQKYADLEDNRQPARSKNTDETRKINKLMMIPSARPMYAAVVDGMDQAIGQVLDTLDDEGIADNTIVLFFSDNGGAAYATGGADNVPLRGGKGETWEGGIRVVSLLRWPTALEGGGQMQQIMTAMDVFPTLAAAAGLEPANETFELDGRDMWPAIARGEKIPRGDLVFFASETPIRGSFMFTAFNDHWKLVQEVQQGLLSATVTNYLFRISEDPNEYNNLASEYPEVVTEMAGAIHYWRTLYPVAGTHLSPVHRANPGTARPGDASGFCPKATGLAAR
jgi:arylsulfatase A-like enzyme